MLIESSCWTNRITRNAYPSRDDWSVVCLLVGMICLWKIEKISDQTWLLRHQLVRPRPRRVRRRGSSRAPIAAKNSTPTTTGRSTREFTPGCCPTSVHNVEKHSQTGETSLLYSMKAVHQLSNLHVAMSMFLIRKGISDGKGRNLSLL